MEGAFGQQAHEVNAHRRMHTIGDMNGIGRFGQGVMIPAARQIEQIALLQMRLETQPALGFVMELLRLTAKNRMRHRPFRAAFPDVPDLLPFHLHGPYIMRIVMGVKCFVALPGYVDIGLGLAEASAFQGSGNIRQARRQAIHIIHDHGSTARHPFLHLGGDGLQGIGAITRQRALAILRGGDCGAVQHQLQAAFGPDMGHAEQAIDAGPIQHIREFFRSPRQMQRLLVVILGKEAFRRHRRQDIGQGHAHGALIPEETGPGRGPALDAARGIGRYDPLDFCAAVKKPWADIALPTSPYLRLRQGSTSNCCHSQKTANHLFMEDNNSELRTALTNARLFWNYEPASMDSKAQK